LKASTNGCAPQGQASLDRMACSMRCAVDCAAATENDELRSKGSKRKCRYLQTTRLNAVVTEARDHRSANITLGMRRPVEPNRGTTKPGTCDLISRAARGLTAIRDGALGRFRETILSLNGIEKAAYTKFLRDLGRSQVEGFASVRYCLTPSRGGSVEAVIFDKLSASGSRRDCDRRRIAGIHIASDIGHKAGHPVTSLS